MISENSTLKLSHKHHLTTATNLLILLKIEYETTSKLRFAMLQPVPSKKTDTYLSPRPALSVHCQDQDGTGKESFIPLFPSLSAVPKRTPKTQTLVPGTPSAAIFAWDDAFFRDAQNWFLGRFHLAHCMVWVETAQAINIDDPFRNPRQYYTGGHSCFTNLWHLISFISHPNQRGENKVSNA